jgi:putative DNA primase/helicase
VAYEILTLADLETEEVALVEPGQIGCSFENHPAWNELNNCAKNGNVGFSQLFKEVFRQQFRYMPVQNVWLHYDGGQWLLDSNGAKVHQTVIQFAHTASKKCFDHSVQVDEPVRDSVPKWRTAVNNRGSEKFIRHFLQKESDLFVYLPDMDAKRGQLNLKNGTFNFETGQLERHNPNDLCAKSAKFDYKPGGRCDLFLSTLERNAQATTSPKEWLMVMQEIIGVAFHGNHQLLKHCFILVGDGDNAKSSLLNALYRLLGDYATSVGTSTFSYTSQVRKDGTRSDLLELVGKRLVVTPDYPSVRLDLESLKAVTGSDLIAARGLHDKVATKFEATCVLFFSTNTLPLIAEVDNAGWKRPVVIPFNGKFEDSEKDPRWTEKVIESEGSGILDWAYEGFKRLESNSWILTHCPAITEAGAAYRADMSLVSRFLQDATVPAGDSDVIGSSYFTSKEHVYSHYQVWGKSTGSPVMGEKEFCKQMKPFQKNLYYTKSKGQWVSGWGVQLLPLGALESEQSPKVRVLVNGEFREADPLELLRLGSLRTKN